MCFGVFDRWSSPRMTVGDLHGRVVDDDREVVQRRAVGAHDHEVAAEVGHVELDVAAHDVVEADEPLADAEPKRTAASLGLAGQPLLGRQVRAPTDVAGRQLGRLLRLAVGVELLGRAVAGIGEVVGEQALRPRRHSSAGAPSGGTARAGRVPAPRPPPAPRPRSGPASAARRGCPARIRPCCARRPCPRVAARRCRRRAGRAGS